MQQNKSIINKKLAIIIGTLWALTGPTSLLSDGNKAVFGLVAMTIFWLVIYFVILGIIAAIQGKSKTGTSTTVGMGREVSNGSGMLKCPRCEKSITYNAKFCPNCGESLE